MTDDVTRDGTSAVTSATIADVIIDVTSDADVIVDVTSDAASTRHVAERVTSPSLLGP